MSEIHLTPINQPSSNPPSTASSPSSSPSNLKTGKTLPTGNYNLSNGDLTAPEGQTSLKLKKTGSTLINQPLNIPGTDLHIKFHEKTGKITFEVTFLTKTYIGEVEGITLADLQNAATTIPKIMSIVKSALNDVENSLLSMPPKDRENVRLETWGQEGVGVSGGRYRKHTPLVVPPSREGLQQLAQELPEFSKGLKTAAKTNIYYDTFLDALASGAKGPISEKIQKFRRTLSTQSQPIQSQQSPSEKKQMMQGLIETIGKERNPQTFHGYLISFKAQIVQLQDPNEQLAYCKVLYAKLEQDPQSGEGWGIAHGLFLNTMKDFLDSCLDKKVSDQFHVKQQKGTFDQPEDDTPSAVLLDAITQITDADRSHFVKQTEKPTPPSPSPKIPQYSLDNVQEYKNELSGDAGDIKENLAKGLQTGHGNQYERFLKKFEKNQQSKTADEQAKLALIFYNEVCGHKNKTGYVPIDKNFEMMIIQFLEETIKDPEHQAGFRKALGMSVLPTETHGKNEKHQSTFQSGTDIGSTTRKRNIRNNENND